VQEQPVPGALSALPDPGELKTDNCFSTAPLAHLGQEIFSPTERTICSK
jgi:hypothetical protein